MEKTVVICCIVLRHHDGLLLAWSSIGSSVPVLEICQKLFRILVSPHHVVRLLCRVFPDVEQIPGTLVEVVGCSAEIPLIQEIVLHLPEQECNLGVRIPDALSLILMEVVHQGLPRGISPLCISVPVGVPHKLVSGSCAVIDLSRVCFVRNAAPILDIVGPECALFLNLCQKSAGPFCGKTYALRCCIDLFGNCQSRSFPFHFELLFVFLFLHELHKHIDDRCPGRRILRQRINILVNPGCWNVHRITPSAPLTRP